MGYLLSMEIELNNKKVNVIDIEMGGIHSWDAPDYSDAHLTDGLIQMENGKYRELTIQELNEINSDSETVYAFVLEYLF